MGTMAIVCPAQRTAVAVLGNCSMSQSLFAVSLFDPSVTVVDPPLAEPLTPIEEDPDLYPRLVGRYVLAPGAECLIEADSGGLIARAPDAPRLRLRRHDHAGFFNPGQGARAEFELPAEGLAEALTVTMPGMPAMRAPRAD
jgi:hypothetical protein